MPGVKIERRMQAISCLNLMHFFQMKRLEKEQRIVLNNTKRVLDLNH